MSDVTCQFCGDGGFDLPGLKLHIQRGWCEAFNAIEDVPDLMTTIIERRNAEIGNCTLGCGEFGQCKANMHGTPDECPARSSSSNAGVAATAKTADETRNGDTK